MTDTTAAQRSLEKHAVFEKLLEDGIASVHFDPRCPGVLVPPWLNDQPVLVLNFSHQFLVDDFEYDDDMAFASLSFSGRPQPCRVPWSAVFAITDSDREAGGAWPEDLPREARADGQPVADDKPVADAGLRLVPGGGSDSRSPPARGHLRRVK